MAADIPTKSRELVLARQLGCCFRCGVKLKINGGVWAHRRTRAVRDEHCMCPCNGIYLCRTDDAWASGVGRFEANRLGLLVSRYEPDPATVPVWHVQYGWINLDHVGGYEYNLEKAGDGA